MKAFLNGFESNEATFKAIAEIPAGRVVALQADKTVSYPTNPKEFTGVIASCKDNVASVVMKGYAVAKFNNTLPHVGICYLAPSTNGYMEVNETDGKPYTVVGVDNSNNTIEFIL